MSVIYFGISSEEHIGKKIKNWISITGKPDIFAERDDHVDKYKKKLLGKYRVVSIDEALRRYPDANVWVTFGVPAYIPELLASKMPPERIHFLAADLEYRNGCPYLGNYIVYAKDYFTPCSVGGRSPIYNTSGTVRERLTQWRNDITNLIDDIRCDRPNKCQGCHIIKPGFWRKSVAINVWCFAVSNPGDVCNFRCTYCYSRNSLERLKQEKHDRAPGEFTTYEILQQLAEMPEYNTESFEIRLANGEFCANKHCNEMLDILLKTKWRIFLSSNCSIYREKLAEFMLTGRINDLVTSIDAGTRETFKKIKQNDMFDKVVENLKKYPVNKTRLTLKYIFLDGVNDNETDIDGFYDIAKEVGCKIIMLDNNIMENFTLFTDKMRELTLRIIKKAKADGIFVQPGTKTLNPIDDKFIRDSYSSM